MELNKRYIVDLTQAQTPADIVFELSNVIEKQEAADQEVWLKLGDVALNQSQLLSINSLISSISSTLVFIESSSPQTELAAATLGICTGNIEEKLQDELSSLDAVIVVVDAFIVAEYEVTFLLNFIEALLSDNALKLLLFDNTGIVIVFADKFSVLEFSSDITIPLNVSVALEVIEEDNLIFIVATFALDTPCAL